MKILSILLTLFTGFILGYFANSDFIKNDKLELCRIETGVGDAYIQISTDSFQEFNQSIYCSVKISDDYVVMPTTFCGGTKLGRKISKDDFIIKKAKQNELVAISFKENPEDYLCIYDFTTGEKWPWRASCESSESYKIRGDKLKLVLKNR